MSNDKSNNLFESARDNKTTRKETVELRRSCGHCTYNTKMLSFYLLKFGKTFCINNAFLQIVLKYITLM